MRAVLVTVALLAAIVTGGVLAYRSRTGEWPTVRDLDHIQLVRAPGGEAPQVMHTIWLDRRGAELTAGADDAQAGKSSIVAGAGKQQVTIPPFRGTDKQWRQIVDCLRGQYGAFDVELVEERPPSDKPYIHAVFGGTPSLVGFPKTVGGLAPYSGEPVPDAVVMIFTHALGERVRQVCETAAMEIAHAYGLDHVYLCKDPMSYLTGCGAKAFQDKVARCGEKKPRDCGDGQPTQNSFARLMGVLGARSAP